MVGDRMDTDIVAGLEAGMHTVLVLTGSTSARGRAVPVRPSRIVDRSPISSTSSERTPRPRSTAGPRLEVPRRHTRRPRRASRARAAPARASRAGRGSRAAASTTSSCASVDDAAHFLVDQLLGVLGRSRRRPAAAALRRREGARRSGRSRRSCPSGRPSGARSGSAAGCPTRRRCVSSPKTISSAARPPSATLIFALELRLASS